MSRSGVAFTALSSDGATRGIYRSTDGIHWNSIRPANWPDTTRRVLIAMAPSDETSSTSLARRRGGEP